MVKNSKYTERKRMKEIEVRDRRGCIGDDQRFQIPQTRPIRMPEPVKRIQECQIYVLGYT